MSRQTAPAEPAPAETFDAIVRARRSVRGFRPDPVPEAEIEAVFSAALWAPSNCNVQPWSVHLVSGPRLRALGAALAAAGRHGAPPRPDVTMHSTYRGAFRTRQIEAAKALYGAMGIARDDRAARDAAYARNLDAFGAPHAAFVFLGEGLGIREAADLGGFVQTLLLGLTARGIASCAQGALSLYPDIVRAQLGIDDGAQLFCGIAFGYEDPAHPANAARTGRSTLEEMLVRHG